MNIVLTGAGGQVGREVVRCAERDGLKLHAFERAALDITDAQAVARVLTARQADIVINAAAYTAVDDAEQNSDQAYAINRDGPAHIAATCARLAIPMLHISTDYVFDGKKTEAYREDDPVSPLGVYGQSKWQGEEAVRDATGRHIILRVSWVFGAHGRNFVKTMLRLGRECTELRVVADQQGCPTYAGAIADVLLDLTQRFRSAGSLAWGTYHFCGAPATTWHEFACTIFTEARAHHALQVQTVTPITTADYPTPAARPANSVLNCSKLKDYFGIEPPSWRQDLVSMLTD